MTLDPDGLWPRRSDAARDGLDEDRDVDDLDLALEDDFPVGGGGDDWNVDADERIVDVDDDLADARDDDEDDTRDDDERDDERDDDYLS